MRYIKWVYRDAHSRALRADEAERLLAQQCWCLAIAAAGLGVVAFPGLVLLIVALESKHPSGFVQGVLIVNAVIIGAAFAVSRFTASIKFLVTHIEKHGLARRLGQETVERSEANDPLSTAMGLEGAD